MRCLGPPDRRALFDDGGDYEAFLRVLRATRQRIATRILAYCLMPNHWHLLLWPEEDGALAAFLQRLTTTHVRRWHLHRHSVGRGHLYQGTYKSFPVEDDDHFYAAARYVERNALRANLVAKAEQWRWGSLAQRSGQQHLDEPPELSAWPVARPRNWLAWVNQPHSERELEAIRISVQRGRPFGSDACCRPRNPAALAILPPSQSCRPRNPAAANLRKQTATYALWRQAAGLLQPDRSVGAGFSEAGFRQIQENRFRPKLCHRLLTLSKR